MLRGAQTLGGLQSRGERMHAFASLDEVDAALQAIGGRELVVRLEYVILGKEEEERWAHQLGDPAVATPVDAPQGSLEERVRLLEVQVAELREQVRRSP